jgi:hypothetical protein
MFGHPALGLAEISWRWSMGAGGLALLIGAGLEYLGSLTVDPADIFFLRTRQPALAGKALVHIFGGSAPRAVFVGIILAAGFALAWIVIGALARAATLRAIFDDLRQGSGTNYAGAGRITSLMGLNFMRVAVTLAAFVGLAGAIILPSIRFHGKVMPSATAAMLVLWILFLLWVAWWVLNWFLSLASVFVVGHAQDTFGSIQAAVDLCRRRGRAILGVGSWWSQSWRECRFPWHHSFPPGLS